MSKAQIPIPRVARKPKAKPTVKPPVHHLMYDLDKVAELLSMTRTHINAIITGRSDLPILPTIQDGKFKYVSSILLDEWLADLNALARERSKAS